MAGCPMKALDDADGDECGLADRLVTNSLSACCKSRTQMIRPPHAAPYVPLVPSRAPANTSLCAGQGFSKQSESFPWDGPKHESHTTKEQTHQGTFAVNRRSRTFQLPLRVARASLPRKMTQRGQTGLCVTRKMTRLE